MNEWLNHPSMKNMDPVKLELIRNAAKRTEGKSGRSLAPIMMALITGAQKNGIRIEGLEKPNSDISEEEEDEEY